MNPDSIEARLKRIETTLYLLCRHLGLDPRTNERLADHPPPQPKHER